MCIAHSDYAKLRLIQLIEKDSLTANEVAEIKEIWSNSYA